MDRGVRGQSVADTVCKEKLVGANLLTADDEATLSLIRGRLGENVRITTCGPRTEGSPIKELALGASAGSSP